MVSGFQPNVEVINPQLLFGHNKKGQLLDRLATKLSLGTNLQIIGERRIGKTSVLKCVDVELRNRSSKFLPIYLNYRQHSNVKGYDNAYRLLLSYLHAHVNKYLNATLSKKACVKFDFEQTDNPIQVYELLEAASKHEVGRFIEKYVSWLNEEGVGVILLLDEYESMMTSTFELELGSFFAIRDLSASPPSTPSSPKPLTYIIAGSMPWSKLCDRIGSPEFNNTGELIYVSPIDKSSFTEMWEYCLHTSEEAIQVALRGEFPDVSQVFDLTGGWPFYGKIIGQFAATESSYDEDELYELLRQHFDVSWSRMLVGKQHFVITNTEYIPPSIINDLKKRGLIDIDEVSHNEVQWRGRLWGRYVAEQIEHLDRTAHQEIGIENQEFSQIELIGDEIVELIQAINETCHHHKKAMIFEPTNQDYRIYQSLKTPSRDRKSFALFAAHTYLLIFERTISKSKEHSHPLGLLPESFKKNHSLVQEIDAIRHAYGNAHITQVDTWKPNKQAIDVGEVLLKYLGKRITPDDSQFTELQLKLLIALRDYLNELHQYIGKNA